MRSFVPALREQELLYSAVARGCRYLQVGGVGPFMRELVGRRWAIASVDLPGGLDDLARELPQDARQATVDGWIDHATLMPFHTAFLPAEVRDEARRAMRGEVAGLHARLGLAAFKVRACDRLRFCPDCLEDMEQDGREPWWRRDHQLPGVACCPVHGTMLRLSEVAPHADRHAFVAATRAFCRDDAPPVLADVGGDDLVLLADLARRAAALLSDPPPACGFDEMLAGYRSRLAGVGLMRSRRKVDHAALHAAFRRRWGRTPELVEGLELGDPERSWLSTLVRNRRRAAHPLQHVMLGAMLDDMAEVETDRPFGTGPWTCRNPAAEHHGEAVIVEVGLRHDRGTVYGDFACSCGYLYTRSRSPAGVVGEPRYRRFGPLLAPALQTAVARGDGLRAAARALGLDPKTLMREAAVAGVRVPWSTTASGAVPAPTPARPKALRTRTKAASRRRRRRNWFAIDARLVKSVREAAAAIATEVPPVRVSFAEIERRVARRDWVQKRRSKLPRTVEVMGDAVEGTEAFRRRRLAWCVSKALEAGDLRPCEVLRAAGLPMDWLDEVRAAIARARMLALPVAIVA